MAKGTLTKTQFAAVMGVDRAQPTRWVALGMPESPDGTIPAVEAANWVRQNVRDYKVRGSNGAGQLRAAEVARSEQQLVIAFHLHQEYAVKYAAAALVPLLPPDQVQAVASHMLGKLRADAAESLDSDIALPRGLTSWREDPRFQGNEPREFGWDELLSAEKIET